MQKFYWVSLLMQKGKNVGNCGSMIQADSEEDSITQALKDDDTIAFLRDGYSLLNTVATKLSPNVCPFNSDFDVYYANQMLCIKTGNLSPESIKAILSATNLNEDLQAEISSSIIEGE